MIGTGALRGFGQPTLAVWLRSRALSVNPRKVKFDALGYTPGDPAAQEALERHAGTFILGFNSVLESVDVASLEEPLSRVSADDRGFAYEGAGMGAAVLDMLTPGSSDRLGELLRTHGEPHRFLVHVGAGWALARFKLHPRGRLRALDPTVRWLAIDGMGFHEAAFHPRRFVERQARSRLLRGYEHSVFDQGLGRALWFVECADPERIARTVARFDRERHGDLWSGVGVACSYTSALDAAGIDRVRELSGDYRFHVAQGSAFAAAVRHDEGNLNPHLRIAVELLCGRPAEEVAEAVHRGRAEIRPDSTGASYEAWRAGVRDWIAAGEPHGEGEAARNGSVSALAADG